ncbi:DUF2807 domain-containing protein [Vibrio fluvialis]|nr:DUF2807 domain-containing protein [Vibrio fluvialis]
MDFNVSLNGSAYVEVIFLKSQTGKVNINGSGLVRLNVSSALTGEVNGSGRIEYSGIPRITDKKNKWRWFNNTGVTKNITGDLARVVYLMYSLFSI